MLLKTCQEILSTVEGKCPPSCGLQAMPCACSCRQQVSYSARRLVLSHTKKVYIAPGPGSNTGALAQLLKLPPGLL